MPLVGWLLSSSLKAWQIKDPSSKQLIEFALLERLYPRLFLCNSSEAFDFLYTQRLSGQRNGLLSSNMLTRARANVCFNICKLCILHAESISKVVHIMFAVMVMRLPNDTYNRL